MRTRPSKAKSLVSCDEHTAKAASMTASFKRPMAARMRTISKTAACAGVNCSDQASTKSRAPMNTAASQR